MVKLDLTPNRSNFTVQLNVIMLSVVAPCKTVLIAMPNHQKLRGTAFTTPHLLLTYELVFVIGESYQPRVI
jgi:hypothetical protein